MQQSQPSQGHHAIVFGCSGINGWALVNQLLTNYPAPETFSRVTAVANRAFTAEEAKWPTDDRLQIVSGVDLLAGDDAALKKTLAEKISSIDTISHVYYAAYRASDVPAEECRLNKEMLRAAVQTLEALSPKLSFAYGVYLLDKFPFRNQIPLKEDLPRVPAEYAKDLFYYHEVDLLQELCIGKTWSWCEVRPDVIVGLAPFGNANCMAQTMGIYLSLYRALEGPNARVPFPGNSTTWTLQSTDSNQDIIARFCIHASLQPREKVHTRAFNIADSARPVAWSERWPILASYFGLEGVGPEEGSLHPTEYMDRNWEKLRQLCSKREGVKEEVIYRSMHNTGARMGSLRLMDFDRPFDLGRAREIGFTEEMDTRTSWFGAFERVRGMGIML
ncbi:SirQ [Aspergillus luchuensis IFO 4308]|nr:SirQ [Aspergillus luchuensis IFO 4308]